jgi:hypothetical protein
LLRIKAVGQGRIKDKMEAKIDDEERVFEEKTSKPGGVDQAFADADEKGFQVGADGMSRPPARRTGSLPVFDEAPIKEREKVPVLTDDRINSEQSGEGGLVKKRRSRYHNRELLCLME